MVTPYREGSLFRVTSAEGGGEALFCGLYLAQWGSSALVTYLSFSWLRVSELKTVTVQ